MPACVIGQLDIHDPEACEACLAGFLPSFERHGGELLATSRAETEVLEGDWAQIAVCAREIDADHWREGYRKAGLDV